MKRKGIIKGLCCAALLLLLTGCGAAKEDAGGTETYDSQKDSLKQAGLGAMALLYDDTVWTYAEEESTDASLVFRDREDSVLGVSCSNTRWICSIWRSRFMPRFRATKK